MLFFVEGLLLLHEAGNIGSKAAAGLRAGLLIVILIDALAALGLLFPAAVGRLFTGKLRPFAIAFSAVLGTAVVCILAVCLLIGAAANNAPTEDEDVTVVVLGCQVKGSRSGIMLRQRIETAYEYLDAHPEALCVATGGKGSGENISEGECIRRELVELGIANDRIFVEDRSVNTAENMAFSAEIIAENGLSPTILVASDNFHQLRASIFASRVGLDARALGCESPWYLAAGYWAREVMALAAAYIRGY